MITIDEQIVLAEWQFNIAIVGMIAMPISAFHTDIQKVLITILPDDNYIMVKNGPLGHIVFLYQKVTQYHLISFKL